MVLIRRELTYTIDAMAEGVAIGWIVDGEGPEIRISADPNGRMFKA